MSWTTERTAIEGRFSAWTSTRIKWPNKPFAEPAVPWIAVHILNGDAQEATFGLPILRRHIGVVSVQCFAQENSGEIALRTITDAIEALFIGANSRITISATEWLDFSAPSLSPGQTVNGYFQRNVNVPFQRNEAK